MFDRGKPRLHPTRESPKARGMTAFGSLWPRLLRWGLALGVVLACGASGPIPIAPSGGLAPGAEGSTGTSGPFRVVFAGPRGEAAEGAEISVVFDRPLIPLEAAGSEPPKITLQPPIPGRFRWAGPRALVFVPDAGRLPAATEIHVEIPGALRAMDGSRLGSPYRFTFSTPRPAVVTTTPEDGARGVLPTTTLTLEFNQAVDPEQVQAHGQLTAAGKPVPFTARRAEPNATKKLVIAPRAQLPIDAEIRFTLAETLTGTEGPLPAGKARSITFRTYGPLRVSHVECNRESIHGHCAPGSPVGVAFTNPVRFVEVKRALRLTPEIPLTWPRWYDDTWTTTYVDITAPLAAGARYTLVIGPGLTDVHGQKLGREFRREIVMDDHFPRVAIGLEDGTLLAGERGPIPIVAVNAPDARVRATPLSRDDVVRLVSGSLELGELLQRRAPGSELRLPRGAPRNQIVRRTLDPRTALGPSGLGVLGLIADYTPDARDYAAPSGGTVAKVSDLGIAAKMSRHGSLVWVTRLSTAEALAGAEVELARSDGQRRRYRTNADGLADIPPEDFAPKLEWDSPDRKGVVFAASGDDWNYERLADLTAPWSLDIPMDLSGAEHDDGLLFTDRGVYRPGDAVAVKGIVRRRTARGSAIPNGERVTIALEGPSGEVLRRVEARVSAWGTFHANLRLPPASGLGVHRLAASLGRNAIDAHVQVQEYRPAEFRVDVSGPEQAVRGERVPFDVQASYLFGAPMANAAVRYSVTREAAAFTPPGAEGLITDASAYYVDLPEAALSGGSLADTTAQLDGNGSLKVEQLLTLPGQRTAERVLLEAEVTDVARQTGAGRASVLVHPARFYVGIQPLDGFVGKTPGQLAPKVAVITPSGKREAGRRVELELLRRRFTSVQDDTGDGPRTRWKTEDRSVARCTVVSTATTASCSLTVQAPGYHILRARSTDAQGNTAEAATPVYALGTAADVFPRRDDQVELVLDKKLYRVGDRARVVVKSPFPEAEALITVERAGILHRERRTLRGSLPSFEIAVTEAQRPNAFVGVHLVRKATPGSTEDAYRYGYAELKVDPEEKRLFVDVTPNRREVGPGQEIEVAVSVKDRNQRGQPAEVTLYAVDEGVLLLTDYRVPDPLRTFTATRPLEVATLDTRAHLVNLKARNLDRVVLGGKLEGGGGGDYSVRRDFQQTAYFNPNLVTDQDGRARVKFKLPESLTRFRLMAVAVGRGEQYGFGSNDVTISKRLMLRPALPRFLRVGDRVQAGVVVNGKRFGPADVTVRAAAKGLELDGPREQRIRLPADGTAEVRFAFRATTAGRATLSFEARGGAERDAVAVERVVSAPTVLEATSVSGSTTDAVGERLGDLRGLRRDVGGLELSVAPTALVGLESALEALGEYPYGCTEQLASRLVPWIVRAGLGESATSKTEPGALVRRILARQLGDGGFGFWDEARQSHAWVSAYALEVLHAARQRGLEVPAQRMKAATEYLRSYLGGLSGDPIERATAAYALDVLARLGEPDAGFANRLFETRKELPLFARALLLSAIATAKGDASQIQALTTELEGAIRVGDDRAVVVENLGDAYAVLMDSTARTHALVLRALLAARPDHPLIPALARGLLAARRGGTWATTQESAFALLALDRYRATREAEPPAFEARARLGEHTLLTARFDGHSTKSQTVSVPMAQLLGGEATSQPLIFERDGRGTLFYQARLRYARAELPRAPLDAGLYVEKTLRAVDPASLGALPPGAPATGFRGGDLVLGELLVVSATPREYVVIDDPLPAGFEAINAALHTTASRYDLASSPDGAECPYCGPEERDAIAEGRAVRRTDSRRELFDDRVAFLVDHLSPGVHRFRYLARATTLGEYVVPPTRAFAMYEPEVFGRTAAGSVVVR